MSVALDHPAPSALEQLATDVELVQAATRRLLLAMLELDQEGFAGPAASLLGTRRHVVARLVRSTRRRAAALEGRPEPIADDRLLRVDAAAVVDEAATALGELLSALATVMPGARMQSALAIASEHLAALELSHVDLDVGYALDEVPDAALDAIAAHFHDEQSSPFAALVAH